MSEKVQQRGKALVLRDAQGVLSWIEISSKDKMENIIAARERQGFTVHETTTIERARRLVNPPISNVDDSSQFRR